MIGEPEMILRKTKSICPICNSVTDADLTEEENRIYISRTCPDHGQFKALYWSDAAMFRRFDAYNAIGKGVDNSMTPEERRGCPSDCGLCDQHTSGTLSNLDVTNRCNLNCEFCFANARACGFVYEPNLCTD